MHRTLIIKLAFIFALRLSAQPTTFMSSGDNFSSAWQGDKSHFVIQDGFIRLSVAQAGMSTLYTPYFAVGDQQWNISFRMDFEPSSNNRLVLFLYSESVPDFNHGDALYIIAGQDGTNDALELWQRKSGLSKILTRGQSGAIAKSGIPVELKVNIENGILSLNVDYSGITCYTEEFVIELEEWMEKPGYFGWIAQYTNTRRDRFWWKDIYVGPTIQDVEAPQLERMKYDWREISLFFNEKISGSLLDINITPAINYDYKVEGDMVNIFLEGSLKSQTNYLIELNNVVDCSGNQADTIIEWRTRAIPSKKDIVVNEILFNPYTGGSDFIEILNTSEESYLLSDVVLLNRNNSMTVNLPDVILDPGGILAFTPDSEFLHLNYPHVAKDNIIQTSIPRFNNDRGNVSLIRSLDELVIDEVNYEEGWHNPILRNVKGVSLERINPAGTSDNAENWTSCSENAGFATPGAQNSNRSRAEEINILELKTKYFSPGTMGTDSEMVISFELVKSGYLASVDIFNDAGQPIHRLTNNKLLGTSGEIRWDGRDLANKLLTTGIYIVRVVLFHPDAPPITRKFTTVLVLTQ